MATSKSRKSPLRFLRFGLRSLLGLVTLVAFGLWAYRSAVLPNREQREFLEAAEKLGAHVKVHRWWSGQRVEWTSDLEFGLLDRIAEADFSAGVFLLFDLDDLTSRAKVTDEVVAKLNGFRGLEVLDLSHTPVSDSAVAALTLPRLRRLSLSGCLRVETLHFSRLSRLEEFDASGSVLRAVRFENTPRLRVVDLHRTYITHETMAHLADLPILELNIGNTPVSGEGLALLPASVEVLRIDPTVLDDPGIERIDRLAHLQQLLIGRVVTEQEWERVKTVHRVLNPKGVVVSTSPAKSFWFESDAGH